MSKQSISPLVTDGVRVAVDIGGTFTDLVSYDARDHVVRFEKSLSTPEALQSAVMTCFEKAQVDIARLEHFIHGSTVAINAVIQKTGARTALVTTEGFTDVYEVGRTNRPDTYNLFFEKTQPLVPGTLRFGVTERMTAAGKAHTPLSEAQRQQAVSDLADRVHLPKASLQRFPHELSGGQLQRVCIARAIASKPRLLVLDEPTSSLDLSVRAGILELLDAIRKETGVALLLISHDLETVELMTQRLLVLYLGKVVEQGPTREIFNNPAHPYTQTLMSAHLPADPKAVLSRLPTVGEIPSPLNLPSGCLFSSRCPLVRPQCQQVFPSFFTLNGGPAHAAAHGRK